VKRDRAVSDQQRKFDFTAPRPRPFLAQLPARVDSYEEGMARFFQWRTGLDYYATIDQIVEFVINTKRTKVVDLLCDTATFALRLAGRKGFAGRVYSFDNNITLLERARQRARHLNLSQVAEFREFEEPRWPLADGFAEIVVSIFDLHRRPADQFLQESLRILAPDGYLLLAEVLAPASPHPGFSRFWEKMVIRYVYKNPAEAEGIYYDKEEMIRLLFEAGFRQVVVYGLKAPESPHDGVFSLVAATK
jgi:ubiquinone/menaquinone biosynthesis C-methylase UbiE